MKKLKTLQDLEYTNDNCSVPFELREVARKWIAMILKHYKQQHSKEEYKQLFRIIASKDVTYYAYLASDNVTLISDLDAAAVSSKINWIKHFFNLEG